MWKILAVSPVTKERGMNPRRIVLRANITPGNDVPNEFVVHEQGVCDGKTYYAHGSYFPVRGGSRCNAMCAFESAFKRWQERSAKLILGNTFGEAIKAAFETVTPDDNEGMFFDCIFGEDALEAFKQPVVSCATFGTLLS